MIALLVCGGYTCELSAHMLPRCEPAGTHEHSAPEGKSGCHHCLCHCSLTAIASVDRIGSLQAPVCIGYAPADPAFAPEAMPLGIDHPPQLA
jgi:hypothetical protein